MPPLTVIPWKDYNRRPEVLPLMMRRISNASECRGDVLRNKETGSSIEDGSRASFPLQENMSGEQAGSNPTKATNDFSDLASAKRVLRTSTIVELDWTRERLLRRPILLRAVILRDIGLSRRMSIKDVALASARRARSRSLYTTADNKIREDFAVILDTNDTLVKRELNHSFRKAKEALHAKKPFCVDIDVNQDVADWFDEHMSKSSPFHQYHSATICKGAKLYLTNVTLSAHGEKCNRSKEKTSSCCGFFRGKTQEKQARCSSPQDISAKQQIHLLSEDFQSGSPPASASGSRSIVEDHDNTAEIKIKLDSYE